MKSNNFDSIDQNFSSNYEGDIDLFSVIQNLFKKAQNKGFIILNSCFIDCEKDGFLEFSYEVTRMDKSWNKNISNFVAGLSGIIEKDEKFPELQTLKIPNEVQIEKKALKEAISKFESILDTAYYNSYTLNKETSGLVINKVFKGGYLDNKGNSLSRTNGVIAFLSYLSVHEEQFLSNKGKRKNQTLLEDNLKFDERKFQIEEEVANLDIEIENPKKTSGLRVMIRTGLKAQEVIQNCFKDNENLELTFFDETKEKTPDSWGNSWNKSHILIEMRGNNRNPLNKEKKVVQFELLGVMTRDKTREHIAKVIEEGKIFDPDFENKPDSGRESIDSSKSSDNSSKYLTPNAGEFNGVVSSNNMPHHPSQVPAPIFNPNSAHNVTKSPSQSGSRE